MEKLIKLLNKYAHADFVKYEDGCFMERYGGEGIWYSDVEVISKDFGFIKWLVENNKINFDKTGYKKADFQEVWNGDWRTVKGYEMLLMLLAIQDEPIDFLINVLK